MVGTKEDKIKTLLGCGLTAEVVASAVGVNPSYVSQLMADQNFQDEVLDLRSKSLVAHTSRDLSIDGIEDKLISELSDMIDDGRFSKPEQVLSAFRIINGAKRRGVPARVTPASTTNIVNIQLPPAVKHLFTLSSKNEVTDVNGVTLVTMPSKQLIEQVASRRGEEGDEGVFSKLGRTVQKVITSG